MATRTLEFILGILSIACGVGSLVLHRVLSARLKDALKNEEVFIIPKDVKVFAKREPA